MTAAQPGVLLAVCGLHRGAGTTTTARLLAEYLVRGAAPGSVLLTSARGPDAAPGVEGALKRHAVVVADAGTVDTAAAVLPLASAVIWTLRLDADPASIAAEWSTEAAVSARTARWVAAIAGGDAATARRLAVTLPLGTRAVVLVPQPPARDADEHGRVVCAALVQALA